LLEEEEPVRMVRLMKYTDLGPPPSIQNTQAAPAVQVATAAVRPSIGIPVPVPDAEVSPEQTIMTQTELSAAPAPSTDEGDGGGGFEVEQDIQIDDNLPPPDFVPYEKEPVVVKKVEPKYPEIALRAGLSFDSTPQPLATTGPVLPDGDRVGFSIGAGYDLGGVELSVYNLFLFFEDREVRESFSGYTGDYRNYTNLFGLGLSYDF